MVRKKARCEICYCDTGEILFVVDYSKFHGDRLDITQSLRVVYSHIFYQQSTQFSVTPAVFPGIPGMPGSEARYYDTLHLS